MFYRYLTLPPLVVQLVALKVSFYIRLLFLEFIIYLEMSSKERPQNYET